MTCHVGCFTMPAICLQHDGTYKDDDLDSLHAVIQRAQGTLLVLDPPALMLARIWCLYGGWVGVAMGLWG